MTGPMDMGTQSVTDQLFCLYCDSIPAQNNERFLAVFDNAPCGTPKAQWLMDALDQLDALVDPYRPLPAEARKARGAIRLACMDLLMKLQRDRMRQGIK